MNKARIGVLAVMLLVSQSGCAPLIIGAAVGAVGGYAVSRDTIQGETGKDFDSLWASAKTVAQIRGSIEQVNEQAGYVRFLADSSRVEISLERFSAQMTRVKVTARRYGFPHLKIAQDVYVKVMEGV